MATINITSQSGAVGNGDLQLQNGAPMDATLRLVTDAVNTASPLKLSTALVQTTSTLKITTSDVAYIDAEDNSGNNRFTVSRAVASQLVTVDFASLPTALTTPVGAIRTATDGVNLANVATFLENGKIGLGTDTPATKLEVNDSSGVVGTFKSSSFFGSIDLENTGGSVPAKWNVQSVSGAQVGGTAGDAFGIYSYAATAYRMFINSSGNVGIGTTTPTGKLQINTSSSGAATIAAFLVNENIALNTEVRLAFAANTNSDSSTNRYSYISALNTSGSNGQDLVFATNTTGNSATEKMRITQAGNVGIGTSAPGAVLEVAGTSATTDFRISRTVNNAVYFAITAPGGSPQTSTFSISGTDILQIDANKYIRLTAASGGIQFNGDTAAANALNDYEEGTFTPTIIGSTTAGTATYTTQVGRYTKIGRQVSCQIDLGYNSGTGTGDLGISGLPFAETQATNPAVTIGYIDGITLTALNYALAYIPSSSSRIDIVQLPVGGGVITQVPYDASGRIILNATYIA